MFYDICSERGVEKLDDIKIIELFFSRDERAITETDRKYGRLLAKIAYNILGDIADSNECVNDTYFAAWEKIPPQKPNAFCAFLAKITRNLSIDRFRKNTAQKRNCEYVLSLEELSDTVSGTDSPEDSVIEKELASALNRFLETLPVKNCDIFVMRYFYADSIKDISKYTSFSESKVKTTLSRTRKKLVDFLTKEGFDL